MHTTEREANARNVETRLVANVCLRLYARIARRFRAISAEAWAVAALAFVLVAVKKWDPGDNLDCIFYAAVSRNVSETGNFHHFQISPFFKPTVNDHMPMTYWLTGLIFRWLGLTDFVARLYPMAMSFISYVLVYLIGKETKDRFYGLCSVLALSLAYGFSKWNGALMQDVPLTAFFLATTYFFFRSRKDGRFLLLAALTFVAGIMTKGPIIGALLLALPLWTLIERRCDYLRSKWFFLSVLLGLATMALFFLPAFAIDGQDPFRWFIEAKRDYLATTQTSLLRYFAYIEVVWTNGAPLLLLFIFTLWTWRSQKREPGADDSIRLFCALAVFCVAIPLSFFTVKYPHYMLPIYPFMAIACGDTVSRFARRFEKGLPTFVRRLAIVAMATLLFLPIKTSGGRSKTTLNIINLIKFDPKIRQKGVNFLGDYKDDMSIFQSFKWYGGLDLKPILPAALETLDFKKNYLIVFVKSLPIVVSGRSYDVDSCLLRNWEYCALTDRSQLTLDLPADVFPHEIY